MKCACVTMASGGMGFYSGVCGQKILLNQLMPDVSHGLIVESGAYKPSQVQYLRDIGWQVSIKEPIRTKRTRFAAKRWPKTFTKLSLWDLSQYDRVVYMDADAVPCKPYYELFELDQFAACDIRLGVNTRFRSGMMVVQPNESVFNELLVMAAGDPRKNGAKLGDQGLLNIYFSGGRYKSLNHKYHVCKWGSPKPKVVIGHLRPKPWIPHAKFPSAMKYSVRRWRKAFAECKEQFGPVPE